jgi:hypothetical protein
MIWTVAFLVPATVAATADPRQYNRAREMNAEL